MVAQVPGTREKVLFEAQAPAVSDALPATAMTFHQYNNLTITHPLVNLTKLNLRDTKVKGDVAGLAPLIHLTVLDLIGTKVKGDVAGLAPLIHLTDLRGGTKVVGNLGKLKALQGR